MKATMRAAVVCVGVCAALIVALRARQQATGPVDLILTNGKIITVDPSDSIAQALAIRNGTIAAVGSNEQVRALSGPQTRVLDLNGRTVTPGLIDSHVHFSEAATMYTIDLSGGGVTKMADVLRLVAERVKTAKPGEWVQGRGWDEGKLAERRYITAADLDKVAPAKWELYREILTEGRLSVRMFALWAGGRSVDATRQLLDRIGRLPHPPDIGEGRLISGGVKMYMDGSGGARTAWMCEDWNKNSTEKDAGNTGYPTTPPDEYRQSVTLLHNAGIHVS